MAHAHSLYDTDPHFRIDPVTRNIINMSGKVVLVQHDHNSERFTFEIPRHVDGHDMSLCNRAEIHYINGNAKEKNRGLYSVDDLQIDPNDNGYVICSWIISHNATQLIGPLSFMIRFECLTNDEVDYAWSSAVYSGVTVSQGIYNTDYIVDEYVDILEQWRNELEKASVTMTGIEQTVASTEDSGINEVTMNFSDGSTGTFTVRNGSKGPKGDAGEIVGVTASVDNNVGTPSVTVTPGGTSTERSFDFKFENLKGDRGAAFTYADFTTEQLAALTGPRGTSIQSITRTSGTGEAGTTDTYTIAMTDGTTSTFQVYNGANGEGAGDMLKNVYDPQNKSTDIFAYVDSAVGNINELLDSINGEVV